MDKNLADEVKELNRRIAELEKMLSMILAPLQNAGKTTQNYLRLTGLLLDHGGLTPDLILPEVKDPISREIVQVLMNKSEQNVSEITELVRSKRGTASRRIIREKIQELMGKNVIQSKQMGSRTVYGLTESVIKKWSQMLGFTL